MCRPSGATAPEGRIPSPEGKVPQCAHWGGRGMATACKRYAAKVKWYNVEGRTILTNCLGFQNISPFLFSHKKWFRRAISCDSFPPGEAILRRIAALGGRWPPPLHKPSNNNLSYQSKTELPSGSSVLVIGRIFDRSKCSGRFGWFRPPACTPQAAPARSWRYTWG